MVPSRRTFFFFSWYFSECYTSTTPSSAVCVWNGRNKQKILSLWMTSARLSRLMSVFFPYTHIHFFTVLILTLQSWEDKADTRRQKHIERHNQITNDNHLERNQPVTTSSPDYPSLPQVFPHASWTARLDYCFPVFSFRWKETAIRDWRCTIQIWRGE